MTTRPIAAMDIAGLKPGAIPTGKPELTWIDPTELLVDDAYQRGLSEKGHRLIRQIIEHFDWRRFKPPTCVWTAAGLEVLDGQHSALAAASHPAVDQIPVVVVEAEQIEDRAGAFLGMNRDRLNITAMQLHAAAVVAGDQGALTIERLCQASGVSVLRSPPSNGAYKAKDTVAVRAIGDMIKRVGEQVAAQVISALAEADLAPISAAALRAAEAIIVEPEYADQVEPAELTRAIVALGPEANKEADLFAATHCVPKWRGLVAVWFKKTKKRRPESGSGGARASVQSVVPVVKTESNAPAGQRPVSRFLGGGGKFSGTSAQMIGQHVSLGDPLPGQSALDQGYKPGGALR